MRKYLILIFTAICLTFCANHREVRRIRNFVEAHTGLDTLIRIDGYFYRSDSIWLNLPFILLDNGRVYTTNGRFSTHNQIQEFFNHSPNRRRNAYYTLSNDTIKIRSASRFDFMSYDIFLTKFVIVNDTTLRQIWHVCETGCGRGRDEQPDSVMDEIFKFFQYDFDFGTE